ncbi:MAG: hypothetical protein IT440_08255 [Phycisphaeraceae bacterium]|nr:hypothetical protein [Phycisphaeraceae bacterium]
MATHRVILASHLILTGYGHWLPNDPRGSGSMELKKDTLAPLGDIHFGRKVVQPPRSEVKAFYQDAKGKLEFEAIWFDEAMRQTIGDAFREVVKTKGYTVWACAVLSNHAHLVVRTHRDRAEVIWKYFADASRDALQRTDGHPVWANRPYKVFLHEPDRVRTCIHYVESNPVKERLPRQTWDFVKPYSCVAPATKLALRVTEAEASLPSCTAAPAPRTDSPVARND